MKGAHGVEVIIHDAVGVKVEACIRFSFQFKLIFTSASFEILLFFSVVGPRPPPAFIPRFL